MTFGPFTFVLYQACLEPNVLAKPLDPLIKMAISGIALALVVASYLLRRKAAQSIDTQWMAFTIQSWIMNEAIAILGLFIGIQERNFQTSLPFIAGGFLLTLLMFPKLPERRSPG